LSKVERILNWPVPQNATDVRSYLGLVCYVSAFLLKLADYTSVLTPLTTKDAHKHSPLWTDEHQYSFDAIKALVVGANCLTDIDHDSPGDNKIFVTCDASDWRTSTVLSFGPTWESAQPVAYDSMQLKDAEKNYSIHEKELLAIIRAPKKWRADLLGSPIYVYTDHKTLENFDTQKYLSRHQLRWQEFFGELAPLLSVLGHQMHKCHKSAATSIWMCRPIWMCVAVLSDRAVSYQFLLSPLTLRNNCNF
jgi:hypothetical protein